MKEKLTRNIGLKVLSIILAAILWLAITNLDDPIRTRNFENVKVTVKGASEIEKLGQVYEIIEGETVDFTIQARRSIEERLSSSDFIVTADLANLSDLNTVSIKITCPRYGDKVTITNVSTQVMKVEREEVDEDRFSVNVRIKGEPADGYHVYEKSVKKLVSVSGPKSKIEKISQIIVEVDVTGETRSFEIDEVPKAIDDEGNEITNLDFGVSTVTAEIKLYPTKEIAFEVIPKGKPASGFVMLTPDYEPKKIEVAGPKDDLKKIDKLTIEESIDGATESIEKAVNIADSLPDRLILVGETQTASVDFPIVRAETKDFLIWPEDITVKNTPENLDLVFQNIGPITAKITGPADVVKDLTLKNLKPMIDLDRYTSGSYEVVLGLTLPEFTTLENNASVRVLLKY